MHLNDDRHGVLLVRKVRHMLDGTFGYRGDRLSEVNDVIDVLDAVGNSVRAQVNGIEKAKSLPMSRSRAVAARRQAPW